MRTRRMRGDVVHERRRKMITEVAYIVMVVGLICKHIVAHVRVINVGTQSFYYE